MASHAALLAEHGYAVTIVAGRGASLAGSDYVLLPLLDSKNAEVLAVHEYLEKGVVGSRFYELEERIASDLRAALEGVAVCIVHNAFTLHKSLPLTAALHRLIKEGIGTRFVAWCHDVAWVNPLYLPHLHPVFPFTLLRTPLPQVAYVTVSEIRRKELAETMQLPPDKVSAIPNGISPEKFLKLSGTGRQLAKDLELLDQDIALLLPARIT
ncbi:MAG: glycosyltransferase, partial [Chloroflexi bacterium]|nr:glycosyltransferase [Chloroflexota bacterium]